MRTRHVSYRKQELLALLDQMDLQLIYCGVRVAHFLFFYFLCVVLFVFVLCIVASVPGVFCLSIRGCTFGFLLRLCIKLE